MRFHHRLLTQTRRSAVAQASGGFTLVELLLAASLGVGIAVVAGDAMLSHLKTNQRLEAIERQRSEWARTNQFLEAEVALSERILSDQALIANSQCTGLGKSGSEFLFALDIRRDLPLAIYYLRPNGGTREWAGDLSLWRCGPTINEDGTYGDQLSASSNSTSEQILVDGMGASCSLQRAPQQPSIAKSLQYNLCLQGLSRQQYQQSGQVFSRVSPVFSFPTDTSLCSTTDLRIEGFYRLGGGSSGADSLRVPVGAVPSNTDVLICGYGGGDTITGSTANDVLEAGEIGPGATVIGQTGNDRLRGSPGNDALYGNGGDDVLLGLAGNDTLDGGSGENRYLPGLGNDTVRGGSNLDVVFLEKGKGTYSGLGSCNRSLCTLTYTDNNITYTLTLTNVEVLIFRDGRVDLPGSASSTPLPVG